jgi:hypothetical protein
MDYDTEQAVARQNELLQFAASPKTRQELQDFLGYSAREHFRSEVLNALLELGLLVRAIPGKPKSRLQKYRRK